MCELVGNRGERLPRCPKRPMARGGVERSPHSTPRGGVFLNSRVLPRGPLATPAPPRYFVRRFRDSLYGYNYCKKYLDLGSEVYVYGFLYFFQIFFQLFTENSCNTFSALVHPVKFRETVKFRRIRER